MKQAITTRGLGKRYGRRWALGDCTIEVPRGRITALVGPNGAGKTTLLKLLAGQSKPTSGDMQVLDQTPDQSEAFLARIGYVAQDVPLYKRFTAADHIHMGQKLNPHWDSDIALQRLASLEIPLDRPVKTLSGGQQAQLSLALALAKQPQLLLLDEPVAALDPLARRDFLAALAEAAAEGELSIVLSSHILADLERMCDYLIMLGHGHTKLIGDADDIVQTHRLLTGPRTDAVRAAKDSTIVVSTHTARESSFVIRCADRYTPPVGLQAHRMTLEDITLAYMRQDTKNKKGVTA